MSGEMSGRWAQGQVTFWTLLSCLTFVGKKDWILGFYTEVSSSLEKDVDKHLGWVEAKISVKKKKKIKILMWSKLGVVAYAY